jgi:hypothetical protein
VIFVSTESPSPRPATGWTAIRKAVAEWPRPALLVLLNDLHDASPENRAFLRARFEAESASGAALELYRRKIVEQFFPARGYGKLKLGEARKAIRDYRKATGNRIGTMELLLTYVENGTKFTRDFGDINEAYYRSLESAATELGQLLLREGQAAYLPLRDRIQRVESLAGGIGWGYGDFIREWAWTLETELGSA